MTGVRRSLARIGTLPRHLGATLVAAALLYGMTLVLDPFWDYQIAAAAAYLCAAAGLTVLTGHNGQISLGHGALMAIGAYTVAFAQNWFGDHGMTAQWMLLVSLLAGVATATGAGAVVGAAAARLRGPYLAGFTLVVALAVPAVTTVWGGVFHGDQGVPVNLDPPPAGLGADFPNERWQAWLALAAALVTVFLLANLTSGRFGRRLRAVRDDEAAARLAGIRVGRTQVAAFVVSAGCAGLAGGMFAVLAQNVLPGAFSLTLSLNLLLAIVIGGLGSLAGAVWGSLLLVLLPYLTDQVTASASLSPALGQRLTGNLPLALLGLLLIIVMTVAPGGVQGAADRTGRAVLRAARRDGRFRSAAASGAAPQTETGLAEALPDRTSERGVGA